MHNRPEIYVAQIILVAMPEPQFDLVDLHSGGRGSKYCFSWLRLQTLEFTKENVYLNAVSTGLTRTSGRNAAWDMIVGLP